MTEILKSFIVPSETTMVPLIQQSVEGGKESRLEGLHFSGRRHRWSSDYACLVVTASLARYFVSYLPKDHRIERVYWEFEDDILTIWTVINEPDYQLQPRIYRAELEFMSKFPTIHCDFAVIYRFDKEIADIRPHGANPVAFEW